MNGVIEENHVKFKQTSKGIWYCDGLTIYHKDITTAINMSEDAMKCIVNLLERKNQSD